MMTYHTSTLFGNECLDNKNAFPPVELQYQEMLSVKKVLVIQLLYNRHNVSVVLIEDVAHALCGSRVLLSWSTLDVVQNHCVRGAK